MILHPGIFGSQTIHFSECVKYDVFAFSRDFVLKKRKQPVGKALEIHGSGNAACSPAGRWLGDPSDRINMLNLVMSEDSVTLRDVTIDLMVIYIYDYIYGTPL